MTSLGTTTLPGLLQRWAEAAPQAVAFWSKRQGIWQALNWSQAWAATQGFAAFLGRAGFGPGDLLLVLGESSCEWILADLAAQSLGGASVCANPGDSAEELAASLHGMALHHAVVGSPALAAVLRQAGIATPIVLLQSAPSGEDFMARCSTLGPAATTAMQGVGDIATIVFDRGLPVKLSHQALIGAAETMGQRLGLRDGAQDMLCQLPFSLVPERIIGPVLQLLRGGTLFFPESIDTIGTALQEVRPGTLSALPWQWDMLRTQITRRLHDLPRPLRHLADRAIRRPSGLSRSIVSRPLRHQLGLQRTRLCFCHGGLPEAETTAFFANLGLTLTMDPAAPDLTVTVPRLDAALPCAQPAQAFGVTGSRSGVL